MSRTTRRLLVVAVIAMAGAPAAAGAQACRGVPIRDGMFGVTGEFSTTDGANGYGAALTANLAGPLSLQAGYTMTDIDDVDENANTFNGSVAYELPVVGFSACPFVGAQYTTWSTRIEAIDVDLTETSIPLGIGIGHQLAAGPGMNLTLFAAPQFLYIRDKIAVGGESETDTSTEFALDLGLRLGTSAIFAGAGVSFTTVEDSDPVYSLGIGIGLGR